MEIRPGSAWDRAQIEDFLGQTRIPLRLASNTARGFPLVNSLWFELSDGALLCATHQSSAIIAHLGRDGRCGFEIAPNEPPYYGVRGQGRASLLREGAAEALGRLIERYLGDSNPGLAAWLLGRAAEEYLIRIEPEWLTAWDFRPRMQPTTAGAPAAQAL